MASHPTIQGSWSDHLQLPFAKPGGAVAGVILVICCIAMEKNTVLIGKSSINIGYNGVSWDLIVFNSMMLYPPVICCYGTNGALTKLLWKWRLCSLGKSSNRKIDFPASHG
jgi:hypothetical protein